MRSPAVLVALAPLLIGAVVGVGLRELLEDGSGPAVPVSGAFKDVAARLGLATSQPTRGPCGFNVAGAAWGDVDRDGDPDLFLPRQRRGSQLWLQQGDGRFRERAVPAGLARTGAATAAAFGDYDDDRDLDLLVGTTGRDLLYENHGGVFRRIPLLPRPNGGDPAAGSESEPGAATTAVSWTDFDGDGRLDAFAARGGNCSDDPAPAPNRLYRNVGEGRFGDVSDLLVAPEDAGVTLDAVWFDADSDGVQDVYLGNDDLNDRGNALLQADGSGVAGLPDASGANISRFTMGVAAGDLDGNGLPDLVATDIGREALLLQTAPGRFEERAEQRGFGRETVGSGTESVTWGVALADYDNDGDLDAYSAGGALGLDRIDQDDALYLNVDGRFEERRVPAPGSGRGVAQADWDRDGDVDLVVAQLGEAPLLLENRDRGSGHWLELELIGSDSPRQACGATIRLQAGGDEQSRIVDCRGGDQTIHFGLGAAARADDVSIAWPSGRSQEIGSLRADRIHVVAEPRR